MLVNGIFSFGLFTYSLKKTFWLTLLALSPLLCSGTYCFIFEGVVEVMSLAYVVSVVLFFLTYLSLPFWTKDDRLMYVFDHIMVPILIIVFFGMSIIFYEFAYEILEISILGRIIFFILATFGGIYFYFLSCRVGGIIKKQAEEEVKALFGTEKE